MFRVPTEAVGARRVTLDGPEGHHAANVRRLRTGEPISLTDGLGARGRAVVTEVRRGALDVDVTEWSHDEPPMPRLVVAQALAKGGRDEAAVEAMTEVGVDEIVGWQAARSIAKWTDRTGAKWTGTAEAASRQSRRTRWPSVSGPMTTHDLAARIGESGRAVVLHEAATDVLTSIGFADVAEVLIVVGPEGGVSDDELEVLRTAGAMPVRLGETVLRSSTAGVAALAVIAAHTRWA
jgi:16S rRNA (uracil1498-N3)-methyltransferase